MICVSIAHISQINEALQQGAELIEVRLDLIREDPGEIFSGIPGHMKTIATCRSDGYNDNERKVLLKACMDLGASFIDIELESSPGYASELIYHAQECATDVIVSYHNFGMTPDRDELRGIMDKCYKLGGNIAKIATTVNSREDLNSLLSMYELPGRKVVIGMGGPGRITRVMAPYLGAEFTFASIGGGGETAPGQMTVSQLNDIYKVIDKT
ncbi:MAG: type I 3-dehydroquinate dehydratase [Bacteroidales bacterium]|nr:type I 3-dehydroquinate dehydratase [Bacteroidales bacterium]